MNKSHTDSTVLNEFSPEDREAARAASLHARNMISKMINVRSVPKLECEDATRLRKSGEVPDRMTAIKWKCYDCMGFEAEGHGSILARVMDCPVHGCPLWPWRGGKFDKSLFDGEPEREKAPYKPWLETDGR